jgi:hypothetical protein
MNLTPYLNLVQRLRIYGEIPPVVFKQMGNCLTFLPSPYMSYVNDECYKV